jgi:hypothetical protein
VVAVNWGGFEVAPARRSTSTTTAARLAGRGALALLILLAAVLVLALTACGTSADEPAAGKRPAEEPGRVTAILANPIHDAQVVRGDDGMDHVEYDLLVVNVLNEPVTLSSVAVLDPVGRELQQIDGDALAAATQTLFAHTPSPEIPASAAVAVEVDLILPPGTAPKRVTHRIAYTLPPDTHNAVFIGDPEVDGPEVRVNRRPATVIKPPLEGDGWLVNSACCEPNIHRDTRFALNGRRIETAEIFSVDWALIRNDRIYDGDGSTNEQHYAYGADVLAVADGTVVSVQDGKPDQTPNVPMVPQTQSDFGGNHVFLQIAPNVFALYLHLQPGSITVDVGDVVRAGARLARIGNTGPSGGPHLHFGLADEPDPATGRSLPFVFERFTLVGTLDFETSTGDHLVITPDRRQVRHAYPLYGSVQNFP